MSSQSRNKQPPRELNEEEKNIVICVRHCGRELDDILQGSRRKSESNAKLFAESAASSLFRGINSYANMYEKLKLKSRVALGKLFQRAHDLDDMLDAQDAIEETEGNWRNFLANLDTAVKNAQTMADDGHTFHPFKREGDYIDVAKPKLIDCKTNRECTLEDVLSNHTSMYMLYLPSYLPDTVARWKFAEVAKVIADFRRFNIGFVIITWGPEKVVRAWSKQLLKHVKWSVLWDRDNYFTSALHFNSGCSALWAHEMLDFCGCQKVVYKRTIDPPPNDINWLLWKWVGGEVVIASPKISRLMYKQDLKKETSDQDEDNASNKKVEIPDNSSSARICCIHRSENIADMAAPGSIYKAALTCHASYLNLSENAVMEDIRLHRRLSTPPESTRLQYEAQTGMYYDPETQLHYDSKTGYFYDAVQTMYYIWSKEEYRYLPANTIVQAQMAATHTALIAAGQAAAFRSIAEQEAAKAAGQRVAAQLAAIRSQKDEYSSYAYATCVLSQQPDTTVGDPQANDRAVSIEQSLRLIGTPYQSSASDTILSSKSSSIYPPGCPPPPGV